MYIKRTRAALLSSTASSRSWAFPKMMSEGGMAAMMEHMVASYDQMDSEVSKNARALLLHISMLLLQRLSVIDPLSLVHRHPQRGDVVTVEVVSSTSMPSHLRGPSLTAIVWISTIRPSLLAAAAVSLPHGLWRASCGQQRHSETSFHLHLTSSSSFRVLKLACRRCSKAKR